MVIETGNRNRPPELAASPATPWSETVWGDVHAMLRDAWPDRISISTGMESRVLTIYCRPESECLIWSTRCKETCKDFSEEGDNPSLYPLKESTGSVRGKLRTPNRGISKALQNTLHQQSAAWHSDLGSIPVQTPGAAGMAVGKSQLEFWKSKENAFAFSGPFLLRVMQYSCVLLWIP